MFGRKCLFLCVFACLGAPSEVARAWTNASVRSVHADVRVDPQANASVRLALGLSVRGGWLESMEIDGLGADVTLDPATPPRAWDDAGRTYAVTSDLEDGLLTLRFGPRRDAPHRGALHVEIAYRTSLADQVAWNDDGRARIRWSMPPWEDGLDGVEVDLRAPIGATAELPPEARAGIEVASTDERDTTRLRFHRAHLPRMTEWDLEVSLPAGSLALPRASEQEEAQGPTHVFQLLQANSDPAFLPAFAAAGALFLLWTLSILRLRTRGAMLVSLRVPIRMLALAALAAIGAWLGAHRIPLAIPFWVAATALAIGRNAPPPRAMQFSKWRLARGEELEEASRQKRSSQLGPRAWMDATTVAGALTATAFALIALYGFSRLAPATDANAWAGIVLLFASPLWLTGTRLHAPPTPSESLAALMKIAKAIRTESPTAFALVVLEDAAGSVLDARLRATDPTAPEGLVRCDLAYLSRPERGGWSRELSWVWVAREGTPAARAIALIGEGARVDGGIGRKIARIAPATSDPHASLDRLHAKFVEISAEKPPIRRAA